MSDSERDEALAIIEKDLGIDTSFDGSKAAAEIMIGVRNTELAKVFGKDPTLQNILDQRVTDALKKFVGDNYDGKKAKKLTKLVEKNKLASQSGKLHEREAIHEYQRVTRESSKALKEASSKIEEIEKEIGDNYEIGGEKDAHYSDLGRQLATLEKEKEALEKKIEEGSNFLETLSMPLRAPAGYFGENLEDLRALNKEKARITKEEAEKIGREYNWFDSLKTENLEGTINQSITFEAGEKVLYTKPGETEAKEYEVTGEFGANGRPILRSGGTEFEAGENAEITNSEGKTLKNKTIRDFLSPRELEDLDKKENTRILLRHLQSPVFRNILADKDVDGVRTNFAGGTEASEAKREKDQIEKNQKKDWGELSEILEEFEITEIDGATVESLDFQNLTPRQIEKIRELVFEKIDDNEISSENKQKLVASFEKQIEAKNKAIADREKWILEKQGEKRMHENSLKSLRNKLPQSRHPDQRTSIENEIKETERWVSDINAEIQDWRDEIDEYKEEVFELENETGSQADQQKKARVDSKKSARETETLKTKSELANKLLNSLADGTKKKAELTKKIEAAKKPADKTDSKTLFTRLMVERAKVSECKRLGKEDTADLSAESVARAEKIGQAAAATTLEKNSDASRKKKAGELMAAAIARQEKNSKLEKGKALLSAAVTNTKKLKEPLGRAMAKSDLRFFNFWSKRNKAA